MTIKIMSSWIIAIFSFFLFVKPVIGQKLGDKYLIYKPVSSIPDSKFTYVKVLKKGYNTKTGKLSWDTHTEVNVVHIEDIIHYEFEVIKLNKNGSVIIALNKPSKVGGKEVIHEPRYLVKNFKEALKTKEIITRKDFDKYITTRFPSDKDRLLKRESWVGMNEEQVYISNGKPSRISIVRAGNGIKKQYDYPLLKKKIIVEQGKVTAIKALYY